MTAESCRAAEEAIAKAKAGGKWIAHNHLFGTRPIGSCPKCDEYHRRHPPP